MRRLLVTSALPYANGHIHIGHLVEYIQTDIWVRFQRLMGRHCVYVCADDTHGTAIMIRARQEGRSEEALIADMQAAHQKDFGDFDIQFDNYGSTNSASNKALCGEIWQAIRKAGLVAEREVKQLYDPQAGTFLADRFVKGTCPNPACLSPNQYGDSCDKCGHTHNAVDLINPVSTLSGATPEVRSAPHLFIELERLRAFLVEWTQTPGNLQPEIANYVKGHFLSETLHDWDISRPSPYFGFEIPDAKGHYWYVWFDAPIGYMASTYDWCQRTGGKLDDWWKSPDCEIHHFIGKDITKFHTLFWPGMLKTAGLSLPTKIHIHGFLTVDGEKMAKSKGTFINARTYLDHVKDPSYLRYYYASKLGSGIDDIDLNLDEFVSKVDSDLVGKVVNLASRTAKFVRETGLSKTYPDDGGLFLHAAEQAASIAADYESCEYNKAMRQIMALADRANQYVDQGAPWKLKKDPSQAARMQDVCTVALNLFRQLVVYLSPVLPKLARQTGELLGKPIEYWKEAAEPMVGTPVAEFQHLMQRVDPAKVKDMVKASSEAAPADAGASTSAAPSADGPEALAAEPLAAEITFEEFAKVDLRVARVLAAEDVADSKKLLRLTLSLGGSERRNIFAGIKGVYDPKTLVGRLVIVAANLAPRKMKFGNSEGMVVAAGPGGSDIFLLSPDSGAVPGQRVH